MIRGKLISVGCSCLALTACGGGSSPPPTQVVRGAGFSFEVPAGWDAKRSERGASAADGTRLVSVTRFTLRVTYRPELWTKLVSELDRVAREVAAREGGALSASRTVVVAGRRARQYDVQAGESLAQYTFVLKGKTEYQLLCRDAGEVCAPFVASFRLG